MIQRILIWTLAAAVAVLGLVIQQQQQAIDGIILSLETGTQIDVATTHELAAFRRELDAHIGRIEEMRKSLDFVEQQADILMAAKRSGRNGHKVVDAYLEGQ